VSAQGQQKTGKLNKPARNTDTQGKRKMMNKAAFLEMSPNEQEMVVLAEFPDFEMKAYDDTCFGIFYEVSDEQIEERVKYADDYDTFDTLRFMLPEFNEKRSEEVSGGSPLSETEKLALKGYLAEQSAENWTGVHGWNKTCDDGDVFLVFWGYSEGQGGIRLEYCRAFENEKEAHEWLEIFEIHSYM